MTDTFDTGLRPGDRFALREELDAMPEGTRIWHSNVRYTKGKGTRWLNDRYGNTDALVPDPNGNTQLLSYPADVKFALDTLDQHKWRIFDVGLESGRRYSVNGVPQAMAELGVGLNMFPFGVGQTVSYNRHLTALPEESILSIGHTDMDGYSLFQKINGQWTKVMGNYRYDLSFGRIEQVGEGEPHPMWLTQKPSEMDMKRIKSFRGLVWQVGNSYRQRYGWCDTFITVMNSLDISEAAIHDIDPEDTAQAGEMVMWAQAAAMPLGTMFEYVTAEGDVYWYVRREAPPGREANRAQTRRLAAWDANGTPLRNPSGHYAGQTHPMRVLGRPGEEIPLSTERTGLRRRWEGLPEGTEFRFSTAHNGGHLYTKSRDNRFLDRHGHEARHGDFEWRRVYVVVPAS